MKKLQFITPDFHGALDYFAALTLILAPVLLSLEQESIFVYWFSILAGIGLFGYSLLTNYKLSATRFLSFKVHLMLDLLASAAFILVALVHGGTMLSVSYALIMGVGVIFVVLLSNYEEQEER